jgi:hypothetical protein
MAEFESPPGWVAVVDPVQPDTAGVPAPETDTELTARFDRDAIPMLDELNGGALSRTRHPGSRSFRPETTI